MEIKQIHSMFWADADHTCVGLVADTNTGTNETIATPYNETSIIWNAVKEFSVDQITEYVGPVEPVETVTIN